MASTSGIADLVASFAGAPGIEQAAYDRQMKRVIDAQSAQALLAKRMQEAAASADENRYRQNFENTADMPDMVKYAILSGLGSDYSSAMTGVGTSKENDILESIVRGIQQQQSAGAPPEDVINMLIAARDGKLLGPGNLQVGDQAGAAVDYKQAQARERGTAADKNLALLAQAAAGAVKNAEQGNYARVRANAVGVTPDGQVIPNMEELNSEASKLLWQDPQQIPVEVPVERDWWFDTTKEQMLPMTDPRAQETWAGMDQESRDELARYLGPEFTIWRSQNIGADPTLKDLSTAVGKFLARQAMGGGQAGRPPANLYSSPDQLAADVAAGRVKSGDTVMTPDGPRVVK